MEKETYHTKNPTPIISDPISGKYTNDFRHVGIYANHVLAQFPRNTRSQV